MTEISELHAFAHDLRHYLRAMVTESQMALRRENDLVPSVREGFERIVQAGRSCDELIKAMMSYEEAAAKPDQTWPLKRVIQVVQMETKPLLDPIGGSLSVTAADSPVMVPASLQKIWKELIANAVKFRRPEFPPEVDLEVVVTDRHMRFRISDNGIGIPREHREIVFSAFRRLHGRGKYPGFGLGLATCRKVIRELSGDLRVVDSAEGAALEGWCELPG